MYILNISAIDGFKFKYYLKINFDEDCYLNTVCILVCVVTGLNIILNSQKTGSTLGVTSCCSKCTMSKEYKLWNLCIMNNRLIYFSRPPKGCKCSPLFLAGNYSNKLLIVTLLLLAGDVEVTLDQDGLLFRVDCVR